MNRPPILWTFRRCPYAIRARLALTRAGVRVELREILLRAKPDQFRDASPSATVPALELGSVVLDESLEIMTWALGQNDPDRLLEMPTEGWELIKTNDGPFKERLDHTKYAVRHPELDPVAEREAAAEHLHDLEQRLRGQPWLFGDRQTIADIALLPFIRQFAGIDRPWFNAQPWPALVGWLDRFLDSSDFAGVMMKYPVWSEGDPPTWFG
ncbi:MAG: glutathione S-transferase [Pseudomonadota bacterium]